jgi:hypothetical protein
MTSAHQQVLDQFVYRGLAAPPEDFEDIAPRLLHRFPH